MNNEKSVNKKINTLHLRRNLEQLERMKRSPVILFFRDELEKDIYKIKTKLKKLE